MTIEEAHRVAERKSRYGHRPWIVWSDKQGKAHAERATAETIKQAMLAVGTQGRFTGFWSDGCPMILRWRGALTWLHNARVGMLS